MRKLLLRLHDDDQRHDEMPPDKWDADHPEAEFTDWLEESRRQAAAQNSRYRQPQASSPTR